MNALELTKEWIRQTILENPRTIIHIQGSMIFFVNMKDKVEIPEKLYLAINNDKLLMDLMKKHYRELQTMTPCEFEKQLQDLSVIPGAPVTTFRKRLRFD